MNTSEIFLNIDKLPGILNKSQLYELLEKTKEHKKKELFLGRVPRGYREKRAGYLPNA